MKLKDILTHDEKQKIERFLRRMKMSSCLEDYSDYKTSITLILKNALARVK